MRRFIENRLLELVAISDYCLTLLELGAVRGVKLIRAAWREAMKPYWVLVWVFALAFLILII
jgi:hypothetical protein